MNGNHKDTVNVIVRVFNEKKRIIQSDVIDAEYSKNKDILVYISSAPQSLNIYHPSTDQIESISLNYPPICLSLSSDGNYAVVGHDAHLTYVNVTNKQVIKTCDVSCNPCDIVLGNNNWAYVFPKSDQWTRIRCINLVSGTEVLHQGYDIYAGTLGKMQPSGKYIYGADNGLSPDNLEKYDIRADTLKYMYKSPYWGDYPINGNFWFSEDGTRIFTQGRSVFKTSEIQSQDMIYNGMINFEGNSTSYNNIQSLDNSTAASNLYILFKSADWEGPNLPYVYIHNATNLVFKNKIALEQYLVPDGHGSGKYYNAEPYFVFSNTDGTKIVAITKAYQSGLQYEWALQKFDITQSSQRKK
jgi:hypothetical protein